MKQVVTVFFLFLCAAAPPLRAGGFQLNEHGARAMAQAGAFAARASDPSAVYFNPAGMSYQRGLQIMIGGTLIAPTNRYYGPSNLNWNGEIEMNSQVFTPPNAYVVNTWNDGALEGLAVGVGVTTPYGLGTEWADTWVGQSVTRKIEMQSFYVMPTVSYAFGDLVSVGAGMNIVFANVDMRRAVTNFDPAMELSLDGSSNTAFSWNAGVMVRPLEGLSLGFTYRAETKIDFEGTANFNPPASLAALFPGGAVTTSLTPPATWFAGVAYSPMKNLELEFDYQGVQWSSYKDLSINFAVNASNTPGVKQDNVSSPKDYEDTYILRFGGEYTFADLGLRLRGGYFFDNNPVPDKSLEPLLPDSDRHGVNIGLGYDILPNFSIDVAYLHMFIMDRVTTATTQPEGIWMDGLYRGSADLFGVDLTYAIR